MSGVATEPSIEIPGVAVRALTRHEDPRGAFTETYRQEWFPGAPAMVQGNRSDSAAGVIRGLHFHRRQADYWVCLAGRLRVCLHDLRVGSPTFSVTAGLDLPGDSTLGVYIPPGVAHGFGALEDSTLTYLVDNFYDSTDEYGVAWDDPSIGFDWGIADPILSERDSDNPTIASLATGDLPRFTGA